MNTYQQINLFQTGQPDEEAIRLLRGYEDFAGKLRGIGALIEEVNSERDAQKFRLKVG